MIEIPVEGIATDAAHSTKNKITEFQGIDLRTGKRIFYQNLGNKTVNIGEFLGVVEAAKQLRNTPYRVLIAGRVQEAPLEAELRAVCAGAKNIELRLEYLSEAAYDEAIRQCRYCILNYSENYSLHSSGVVFDILFRGVPIVGSRCGTLQMVEANELGKTVSRMADFAPERLLDEAVHDRYVRNIARYCQSQAQEREKLRDFLTQGAAE